MERSRAGLRIPQAERALKEPEGMLLSAELIDSFLEPRIRHRNA